MRNDTLDEGGSDRDGEKQTDVNDTLKIKQRLVMDWVWGARRGVKMIPRFQIWASQQRVVPFSVKGNIGVVQDDLEVGGTYHELSFRFLDVSMKCPLYNGEVRTVMCAQKTNNGKGCFGTEHRVRGEEEPIDYCETSMLNSQGKKIPEDTENAQPELRGK